MKSFSFGRKRKLKFTDLALLKTIHSMYADSYLDYPNRHTVFYTPITCEGIASNMGVDKELVFQRLYNHLNHKYKYKKDDGAVVHLFAWQLTEKQNYINYPYLSAIVSEMEEKKKQESWALWLAIASIIISLIAIFK